MPNVICPCGFSVPKGTKSDCRQKATVANQKANDDKRGTPAERGYDKDWFKLRHAFLQQHTMCCMPNCSAPATHVDHVKSIREAPHLRLVGSNLRPMCGPCHSRRTARDQSANWGSSKGRLP